MRALLDTNSFLWFISGSSRLSSDACDFISDMDNDLLISIASLWETAIKAGIGKLELLRPFEQLIPDEIRKHEINILPISLNHLYEMMKLEFHHRDPFDRIIIAQGIAEDLPVITSDGIFRKYSIEIIW